MHSTRDRRQRAGARRPAHPASGGDPPGPSPDPRDRGALLGPRPRPGPERARALRPQPAAELRATVEPILGIAISPTMITGSAHERHPGARRGRVRLSPAARRDARGRRADHPAALGEDSYDLEWIEAVGGTRSPLDTPLWDVIESFVAASEPGARVVPVVSPGSRTATSCARPSAPCRTASSPCDDEPLTWPRGFHPLGRAHRGRRSRAGNRVPPARGPYTGSMSHREASDSEEWRSPTACSCTGRATGPAPFRTATKAS